MKKFKYLFLSATLVLNFIISSDLSFAQSNNLTLYNMKSIPQANYLNPAILPDCKFSIGIPILSSFYLGLSHSGFAYDDLVRRRGDDSLYIDMDNVISKLKKTDNYLSFNSSIELFSLGIKFDKNYISLNGSERFSADITYPKDLLTLLWKGNKPFIGKEAEIDGLGINIMHYREIAGGYAREINDKWTVGTKLKLLFGKSNIYTAKSNMSLYTNPEDFTLTGNTNIVLNTSLKSGDESFSDYMFSGGDNLGFAMDLGGTFKLNDKFSFSASIIDLGFIKWKNNVQNSVLDTNFVFNGVEFNYFKNDTTNDIISEVGDLFKVTENNNSYKTTLPLKIFLSGNYTLNEKHVFGLLIRSEIVNGNFHPAFTGSYNRKLAKAFSFSLSYSIVNRSYLNLGAGFSTNGGPFQFYLITDNFLSVILPQSVKTFNILCGMNLTFGRDKKKDVAQKSID